MSDTYLLDTCMLPYLFDDTPPDKADAQTLRFRARLSAVRDATLLICAVTLGEVEFGLRVAPLSDEGKQQKVRDALARFKVVVPLTRDTACPCYAQMKADVFRKYAPASKKNKKRAQLLIDELADPTSGKELTIQENDIWVACIALQYDFVLVSADGDMQRIQSVCSAPLRLENWLE